MIYGLADGEFTGAVFRSCCYWERSLSYPNALLQSARFALLAKAREASAIWNFSLVAIASLLPLVTKLELWIYSVTLIGNQ